MRILELAEKTFNAVVQAIEQRIDGALSLAIDLGRDQLISTVEPSIFAVSAVQTAPSSREREGRYSKLGLLPVSWTSS